MYMYVYAKSNKYAPTTFTRTPTRIYMHKYIHTHIHKYAPTTYIYTYIHICIQRHAHGHLHACKRTHYCARTNVHKYPRTGKRTRPSRPRVARAYERGFIITETHNHTRTQMTKQAHTRYDQERENLESGKSSVGGGVRVSLCVCYCMCTCMHIHTHTCMHTLTRTYIHE